MDRYFELSEKTPLSDEIENSMSLPTSVYKMPITRSIWG